MSLRSRVLYQYKELLYMGRDYPQGYEYFRTRLHKAFKNKSDLRAEYDIERALEHGEYIKKELIALYSLRTYRAVKRNYGY